MKSSKRTTGSPCGLPQPLSRRDILKMFGGTAAGLVSTSVGKAGTILPSAGTSLRATQARNAPRVSIAQATSYDEQLVRQKVRELVDNLGGLADIVRPGDRVAIKVNLTGGTSNAPLPGVSPIESFATHPLVVQALGELLRDVGAGRIYIVEGIFDKRSYADWGYLDAAQAIDATLIDLNQPEPYTEFARVPVGHRWAVYRNFTLHHLLAEVDTFISVAKMKCHWWAGITLSMKNLVGMAPVSSYNSSPDDHNRSAFHGDDSITGTRLPHVVVDLNEARHIDLAIIDGIKTIEGGEGPWQNTTPVNTRVLIGGKSALATDAVATSVMGFDPTTDMPNQPFFRGLNHLNLAYARGLGTNRLNEIEVVGTAIEAVQGYFRPCYPDNSF